MEKFKFNIQSFVSDLIDSNTLQKIMQKSIFLLFSVCFFFLFSCEESDTFSYREGIKEDVAAKNNEAAENNEQTTGQAMFWADKTLYQDNGNITVTCKGSNKTISNFYLYTPDCGASATAIFTLNPGTYSYTATAGIKTWSGVITVTSGGCAKQKIGDTASTNLSLDGKWKDSDGLTVTVSGSNGTFYALGVGNWKTAGDKGYVQVGGSKWRYISQVNSTKWNFQDLWMKTTNGIINGTVWSTDGIIIMSANGQTITTTSTGPISGNPNSVTYTRVN